MLTAIQRKTVGNLNDDEKRLLDHVLYQLRMNYVDVAADQGKEGAEGRADGEAPEAPADAAADQGTGGADEPADGATGEPGPDGSEEEPAAEDDPSEGRNG
jgi:DNA replication initiation complex subunit (GINS family)